MKLSNCKIIGITGGIASGKSTVTDILVKEGFKVIDADKIAKDVVQIGKPAYYEIIKEFGEDILKTDLNIDRNRLGELIFNDDNLRSKLNSIVHPKVFEEIKHLIDKYCVCENVIFLDVPLLIEELDSFKTYNVNIDEIWLVYINREEQLRRLMNRDKYNINEAIARIESQLPLDSKLDYATVIINNNSTIDELIYKVRLLTKSFK